MGRVPPDHRSSRRAAPSRRRLRILLSLLAAVGLLLGCSEEAAAPYTNEELKRKFAALLESAAASDTAIHNAVLLVDAPLRDLAWTGACGIADPSESLAMTGDDQFRIASLGKMMLATVVMSLVEAGSLSLDDSIYHHLPDSIMAGLHVLGGHDYSNEVTIRQLLGHTSGLADYVQDGDENSNGVPDFLELLIAEPGEFWAPEETIEYTKLHLRPLFAPGGGFHYSDTNYQLLGLILQNVTGSALNVLYRQMLFGPLGMDHAYMEYYDEPIPSIPGRGISHVYFGDLDYTGWTSNSADWAGGGIISNAEDLNRFLRAFADDAIFENPQTKDQMLDWLPTGETGLYYGLGTARINLSEFGMPDIGDIYGHEGFPQSFMFYWPREDVIIAGTLNQGITEETHYQQLVLGVIDLLQH
jgi:D-alanyl-D-alanine carboxypeptidase